jgi:hypothetical protein
MTFSHFGEQFVHQVHGLQSAIARYTAYSFVVDVIDVPEILKLHHMERSSMVCPRVVHKDINLPKLFFGSMISPFMNSDTLRERHRPS